MMKDNNSKLYNNIIYNLILTASGYVFPLLTFPYVTRVLGPESYGTANFIMSIVDYAVLLSSLGIGIIGVREIAKCDGDRIKLNKVFSSLLSLHINMVFIITIAYLALVFVVGEFREYYLAYLVGLIKILSNVFLIEWLYGGLQNFRYITNRSIITKAIYVVAIFIFVRNREDYLIYILITVLQVLVNALINWWYSHRFVSFKFSMKDYKTYFSPTISLGFNSILLSFYGTFVVMYLGFTCDSESVGYYTSSSKLYAILLSVLSAFNGGLMPYINTLYGRGESDAMKTAISKSLTLVLMLAIPIAAYGIFMADDIITVIAGSQYERSILPFRILILQVVLVGVSQVTELQVLLTLNKTKQILFCTSISVVASVLIMVLFSPRYAEIAAAFAVMVPHVFETVLLFCFAKKALPFKIPYMSLFTYSILSILIIAIILSIRFFSFNIFWRLALTSVLSVVFYVSSLYLLKDSMAFLMMRKVLDQFHTRRD